MELPPEEVEAEAAVVAEASELPRASERHACFVRWTILLFDVLRVCAGGLIVKFWGLFFVDAYGLSPAAISVLMATIFAVGLVVVVAIGRVVVAYGLRRGVVCLSLLVLVDIGNFAMGVPSLGSNVVAWTAREACLGAMLELKKSLAMDHTPKGSRGVWNAVQGLQQGLWSGTATIGGYVVHAYGFRSDFRLMAWLFLANTCVWVLVARVR